MKNTKTGKTLIMILLVTIFAFIGSYKIIGTKFTAHDNEPKEIVLSELSYNTEINSLNDVIKNSTNIILGTVSERQEFSKFTDKYILSVENNIIGNTQASMIDVYEKKDSLKVGSKYILFLEYADTPLYPNPQYTSVYKECIIEVKGDNLIGNMFIDAKASTTEFISNIQNSPESKNVSARNYEVKNKFENLSDLISYSDYILCIIPENSIQFNKYVKMVDFNLVKEYKGNSLKNEKILLPADVEDGKQYIIFLRNNGNGSIELSSREGSVISEDQIEIWNEVNNKFKLQ